MCIENEHAKLQVDDLFKNKINYSRRKTLPKLASWAQEEELMKDIDFLTLGVNNLFFKLYHFMFYRVWCSK